MTACTVVGSGYCCANKTTYTGTYITGRCKSASCSSGQLCQPYVASTTSGSGSAATTTQGYNKASQSIYCTACSGGCYGAYQCVDSGTCEALKGLATMIIVLIVIAVACPVVAICVCILCCGGAACCIGASVGGAAAGASGSGGSV